MFDRLISVDVDGLIPDGLRIVFKIEKSLVGYPNLGNIKIYNMSHDSRSKISEKGQEIKVNAGYADMIENSIPLLFSGDIINVIHKYIAPDWVTEIFAGDGANVLGSGAVNKSYSPGTTIEEITKDVIKNVENTSKKLAIGFFDGVKNCLSGKRSILRQFQISGSIMAALNFLAKECGFDWSVNDGVAEVFPKGQPVSDVAPIIINQFTGMIGSPERTEVGVDVKSLLLPTLKLGRTIRIESKSEELNVGNLFFRKVPKIKNDGVYRIDKIIHTGDTHSNDWYSDIHGRNF